MFTASMYVEVLKSCHYLLLSLFRSLTISLSHYLSPLLSSPARLLTIRQSLDERIARYYEAKGQPVDVGTDGLIDVSGISLDDGLLKIVYGTSGRGKVFTEAADRCLVLTIYR
jgi:hypothetical protein